MSRFLTDTVRPVFGTSAVRGGQQSIVERVLFAPVAALAVWTERTRQRAALADLDPRLLADIGVSHDEVRRETTKPFWMS